MEPNPKRPCINMRRSIVLSFVVFSTIFAILFTFAGCSEQPPEAPGPEPDPGAFEPQEPEEPEEPATPEPAKLDGMIFVSIGNNSGARPQSGLSKAAVVFEVPAEGGITRLLAGFDIEMEKIGPVRSVRKPMVQIAVGFDTPFAHCGGSEDGLEIIRTNKVKSLCDIYSAGECFWRSSDRVAPDNLYTSTGKIVQGSSSRGFSLSRTDFYPKGTLKGAPALEISYGFSNVAGYPNVVKYLYEDGQYHRYINDKQHLDQDDEAIAPKALAFLQIETTYPTGKLIEMDMDVTGEGKALFFSDGVMCQGKWKKPSLREPLMLYIDEPDAGLAGGMLWIHLVPDLDRVIVGD
ncbi:MAG: DUF3048 domain-containing protein [Bacillota bacterium]|jgi:hypothetical protein|nr:DUF3048 domain-containing protein [Candidatus Fermentithermobacillaceae bacterium]